MRFGWLQDQRDLFKTLHSFETPRNSKSLQEKCYAFIYILFSLLSYVLLHSLLLTLIAISRRDSQMVLKLPAKADLPVIGMATVSSWGAGWAVRPLSGLSGSGPVCSREILREIVCLPNHFLYPSHIGSLLVTDHQNMIEKD